MTKNRTAGKSKRKKRNVITIGTTSNPVEDPNSRTSEYESEDSEDGQDNSVEQGPEEGGVSLIAGITYLHVGNNTQALNTVLSAAGAQGSLKATDVHREELLGDQVSIKSHVGELVDLDVVPDPQSRQQLPESQIAANKKARIISKVQLMKTKNAHETALKGRDAVIYSRDATIKTLERQLREKKEIVRLLETYISVKIGAAVLNRFLELAKVPVLGLSRDELDKKVIAAGNRAAHAGNMLVHKALFDTRLGRVFQGHAVFHKLYRVPYQDGNPALPAILLRALNLRATCVTINDGEGAWDLREKATVHVNTLFKLWKDRTNKDTFESSTFA
ncbi:hypothetical protein BJ878DRAFT_541833 [Calycina marina]|uniref:Uncharacterized protein n=1 Tax=Calycina marina TaxID=1763456 RepID=A0A9P8CFJ2_9HELO|nr:hypothetical protein BJ878DRAFT_541833 [Calycina marina]